MSEGHTYLRTHDLSAEHLAIDLAEAVTALHGSAAPGQDRRGVTLVRQGGLSVVLTHLHAGARLAEHAAPGAVTVQVLDGHVRAWVRGDELDVKSGRLIAIDSGVRHSVEAVEDSTLLLTLADPTAK
jgi:quercetin dioxygenase-like cupin family protein